MSEYTSLDISRCLAEAGFEAPEGFDTVGYPFKWLERTPGDADLVEGWHGVESGNGPIAYRADTLMEWLLARGFISSIISYPDGTKVEYTAKGIWKDIDGNALTLPDSLGEVVLAVLAKERA